MYRLGVDVGSGLRKQDIQVVCQEKSGSNIATAIPKVSRHRAARMGGEDHLADGRPGYGRVSLGHLTSNGAGSRSAGSV